MGKTYRVVAQLALVLVLLFDPSLLSGWGPEGHEVVALLAERRLHSDVRGTVAALLDGTSFVEASRWADQVRDDQTAPWHYVNILITEPQYDAGRVCPHDQCVIGQIERFSHTLSTPDTEFWMRQEALRYLIHLVADLHQPLHVGDNHDRGGNDVIVEFFGQTIDQYKQKPWNLHAVWDSGIVEKRDPDARHYADRLDAWLSRQPQDAFQSGSVVDWAMESHHVAREHVYVLPDDRKLAEGYFNASVPIVDQQLAKAGIRLAKVLNDALGKR